MNSIAIVANSIANPESSVADPTIAVENATTSGADAIFSIEKAAKSVAEAASSIANRSLSAASTACRVESSASATTSLLRNLRRRVKYWRRIGGEDPFSPSPVSLLGAQTIIAGAQNRSGTRPRNLGFAHSFWSGRLVGMPSFYANPHLSATEMGEYRFRLVSVRCVRVTDKRRARVWNAAIVFSLFAVWRVYVIAHSALSAWSFQILSTVVPLAVGIGISVYYFWPRPSGLEPRRLSATTLLLISFVVTVIAILCRHI